MAHRCTGKLLRAKVTHLQTHMPRCTLCTDVKKSTYTPLGPRHKCFKPLNTHTPITVSQRHTHTFKQLATGCSQKSNQITKRCPRDTQHTFAITVPKQQANYWFQKCSIISFKYICILVCPHMTFSSC